MDKVSWVLYELKDLIKNKPTFSVHCTIPGSLYKRDTSLHDDDQAMTKIMLIAVNWMTCLKLVCIREEILARNYQTQPDSSTEDEDPEHNPGKQETTLNNV